MSFSSAEKEQLFQLLESMQKVLETHQILIAQLADQFITLAENAHAKKKTSN